MASLLFSCNILAKEEAKLQPEKVVMSKEDSLKLAKEIENFSPENHVNSMEMFLVNPSTTSKP